MGTLLLIVIIIIKLLLKSLTVFCAYNWLVTGFLDLPSMSFITCLGFITIVESLFHSQDINSVKLVDQVYVEILNICYTTLMLAIISLIHIFLWI